MLTVSLDTEEDSAALEKIAERVIEDVAGEATAQQPMVSPRTSTRMVILETSKDPSSEEVNVADVLSVQVIPLL